MILRNFQLKTVTDESFLDNLVKDIDLEDINEAKEKELSSVITANETPETMLGKLHDQNELCLLIKNLC